ncbi:MAG: hypothetical protein GY751_07705 [Bacteroidetes bacterium]|nr:hypothetical protein [Bacteroidota bacterium]
MESQKIKILLDKYWDGTSTLEEEASLRETFSHEIPSDEKQYALLFEYRSITGSDSGEDFNLDFLPTDELNAENPLKKAEMPSFVKWSMGIAATLLIAIMSVTYQWPQTQTLQAQGQEMEQAYKETLAALQIVSDKLNKGNASIMEIGVFDRTKNHILDENN